MTRVIRLQLLLCFPFTTGCIFEIPLTAFLSSLEKKNPVGVLAFTGPFCGNVARVSAANT